MRLLVCGNRDWTCVKTIDAWLRLYHAHYRGQVTLIHGGNGKRGNDGKTYQGADEIAHDIAVTFGWTIKRYPADWSLGRKAGPIRNQYAFDHGHPERCLAFGRLTKPDSDADSGTGNMVKICNQGGVIVTVVPNPGVLP